MKKIVLTGILALATAALLPAQVDGDRERPEPNLDDVIAHLGLTETQVACLESNQESARESAAPFVEEGRDLRSQLRAATRAGEDTAAIQAALAAVGESLQAVRSSHVATAQSCLDAGQAGALAELVAAETLRSEVQQGTRLLLIEPTEERSGAGQAGPSRRNNGRRGGGGR